MKKVLFALVVIMLASLTSCSSDKDDEVSDWYIYIKDRKNVPCIDEIPKDNLIDQYYKENGSPIKVTEREIKRMTEEGNKQAQTYYETNIVSCEYTLTYIKVEDNMPLPH